MITLDESGIPRQLDNGAHVLAWVPMSSHEGGALVLCWWPKGGDSGEYVSWRVNVRDACSTFIGEYYGADWEGACAAFRKRAGLSIIALADCLGESPALHNCDAWNAPDDFQEIARDDSRPTFYREYASTKERAARARLRGDISTALQWERACENIYRLMPAPFRW
jgi:hypothetical protein